MIPKACMHRPRAEQHDPQSHDLPRVPGERAPSFSVPGLLNSLPRLLLSKAGPFARFLRNMLDEGLQPASTPFVWPCPLPYPEVFRRPCGAHPAESLCGCFVVVVPRQASALSSGNQGAGKA